ncbi:MAG: metallophosphatase family protein [Chloroflexi bacterium]|nr:metallophosphatase family protein [Chloroflexota bacterium]
MRIAIIADIHSNYPALQAVLADIDTQDVDEILVAGDAINGGPNPREVLDVIYERNLKTVIGNHEEYVLTIRTPGHEFPPEWGTSFWTLDQLTHEDITFIENLPASLVVGDMAVFHASPKSLSHSIYPDSTEDTLADLYGKVAQSVIITGHTHLPFVRQWGDKVVINPGSVGMSLDANPMPSYAILTWIEDRFLIQHRRVNYDYRVLTENFEKSGLFESPQRYFARVFHKQMLTGLAYITPLARTVLALEESGIPLAEALPTVDLDALHPKIDYWAD